MAGRSRPAFVGFSANLLGDVGGGGRLAQADRHAVIAYIQPDVSAPVGRCCAAGRYLRYEGVVDGSCKLMASCIRGGKIQRATASTTSVHRRPNQDRRARLLAL